MITPAFVQETSNTKQLIVLSIVAACSMFLLVSLSSIAAEQFRSNNLANFLDRNNHRNNTDNHGNYIGDDFELNSPGSTYAITTPTLDPTITITITDTPTITVTGTVPATPTSTITSTPSITPTGTLRPTATFTPTTRPTVTNTPRPTATNTPRPTATRTPVPTATSTPSPTPTQTVQHVDFNISRKVYVLVYNPTLRNGQTLYQNRGWQDPQAMNNSVINFFKTVSNYGLNYSVTTYNVVNDFTTFQDGSKYTEDSYNACTSNVSNCWSTGGSWRMLDYTKMMNDNGICNLVNSNQVDEVWLYGAGWFGFYEAVQAGSGAFWTNGPTISGTTCNRPVNIMGFNIEVGLGNFIEDFGHRMEGTMSNVYSYRGIDVWNRYIRNIYGNPNPNTHVGCGNIHFTPNSTGGYQWSESSVYANTYCEGFANYPNIIYDTAPTINVNCSVWGCSQVGYFDWWFKHLPRNRGKDVYGRLNNWWNYFIYPETVNTHQETL